MRIERKEIRSLHDAWTVRTYSDIEIVDCKIYGSGFGFRHSRDYRRRTTAERILISDCEIHKSHIGPGLFRDVTIQNIKSDLIIVYAALLEHVTFKGQCGKWMIHGTFLGLPPEQAPAGYREICEQFYAGIDDWAIDIRDAEFEDFSFRTPVVPARLVRRDPETQVIVNRDRVMEGSWRKLDLDSYTRLLLDLMLKEQAVDEVLVVRKRMKGAKKLVDDLRKLQAAGIAEPD